MNMRLMPLVSTEDWAVMAPIPVRTSGVSLARSNPVRQVAEPRTTSPVLVSVMRMDQVAEAWVEARIAGAIAARRVLKGGLGMMYPIYWLNSGKPRVKGGKGRFFGRNGVVGWVMRMKECCWGRLWFGDVDGDVLIDGAVVLFGVCFFGVCVVVLVWVGVCADGWWGREFVLVG